MNTRELEENLMSSGQRTRWRRKYENERADAALFTGLLVGFVAGILWEAFRG